MKFQYPLQNPETTDFTDQVEAATELEEEEIEVVSNEPSEDQLSLDIPMEIPSRYNGLIKRVNQYVEKREQELAVIPFWKSFGPNFAVASGFVLGLGILVTMVTKFTQISPAVPLFYDFNQEHWVPVNKANILIVPIFAIVFNIVIVRIAYSIYNYDSRLAGVVCWLMGIINVLAIFVFGQIYLLSS